MLLFAIPLSIFTGFNASQNLDSRYSLLVSERLITTGTFHLDDIPGLTSPIGDEQADPETPSSLIRINDRTLYFFPPGTSVLAAPFVGVSRALGFGITDDRGRYLHNRESMIGRVIASLLMAGLCVIFYLSSRTFLGPNASLWVAIGGTFGTPIWSTASRAMWSHTWGVFLIGCALLMLIRDAARESLSRSMLLATILSWAFFCRPLFAIPASCVAVYWIYRRRVASIPFLVTGVVWLAVFVAFSWFIYGSLLPPYYRPSRLGSSHLLEALLGHLVSPSRGLLVYVPVVLIPLFLLVRDRHAIRCPDLVWLSLSVICCHLVAISGIPNWWGGHCYGARLSTDLVPWFVLLAILGIDAWLRSQGVSGSVQSRPLKVTAGVLLLMSALMNGQAGIATSPMKWNSHPIEIGRSLEDRLWDWHHPQFLYGLQSVEHGFLAEIAQ
jgi:hypothetical protein